MPYLTFADIDSLKHSLNAPKPLRQASDAVDFAELDLPADKLRGFVHSTGYIRYTHGTQCQLMLKDLAKSF